MSLSSLVKSMQASRHRRDARKEPDQSPVAVLCGFPDRLWFGTEGRGLRRGFLANAFLFFAYTKQASLLGMPVTGCLSENPVPPSGRPVPRAAPGESPGPHADGCLGDEFHCVLPAAGALFGVELPCGGSYHVERGRPVEPGRIFPAALLGEDIFKVLPAGAVVQEAVIADLLKALREDVLEVAPDEFGRRYGKLLLLPAVLPVRV